MYMPALQLSKRTCTVCSTDARLFQQQYTSKHISELLPSTRDNLTNCPSPLNLLRILLANAIIRSVPTMLQQGSVYYSAWLPVNKMGSEVWVGEGGGALVSRSNPLAGLGCRRQQSFQKFS